MSKKKRFISLLVAFTMVFSMIVPSLSFASFSDIEGSKYEEAVEKLVALDTIKGYEDGTFRPNNSITRAELPRSNKSRISPSSSLAPLDTNTSSAEISTPLRA